MLSRRSIRSRILFSTVIGVLLCSVFATELPELLSLTDSTSNDFTLRDAAVRLSPAHTGTQADATIAFELRNFAWALGVLHSLPHESTTPVSADLQYLHSILRT
jgi:hypothetical protein